VLTRDDVMGLKVRVFAEKDMKDGRFEGIAVTV
jgi:hypothetical protein